MLGEGKTIAEAAKELEGEFPGKSVGPARKHQAVAMLRDRLGVSERWACRVVGQHRCTERYEPRHADDEVAIRAQLRQLSKGRPRWGDRRAHHQLTQHGWQTPPAWGLDLTGPRPGR